MAKQIRYTVEVVTNGSTLYYRREVVNATYVDLERASSTFDFAELGLWEEYVKNDLANGSIDSYQIVELELKVKNANVSQEINDAISAAALAKLTQLERDALGV